jgi:hypothetical protein
MIEYDLVFLQSSRTLFRSERYVASILDVNVPGTSLSIAKGTRKIFIPALRKVWIADVDGQM